MNSKSQLESINHKSGMTVPEGYFDDFAANMIKSLPEQDWEKCDESKVMPRSFFQKIRPYVYMAAMFAGVWCMMKMFDLMRPAETPIPESRTFVAAMSNDSFMTDYYIDEIDESEFYDDLYNDGFVPASLKL